MLRRVLLGSALALPLATTPALAQEDGLDNNGHDATNLTKQVQRAQQAEAQDQAQGQDDQQEAAAPRDGIVFPPNAQTRDLAPGEIRDQKGIERQKSDFATPNPKEETASLPDASLSDAQRYKERAESAIRAWDDTIQNPPLGMRDADFTPINDAWAQVQRTWTELETARTDAGPPQNWETLKQDFEQALRQLSDRWQQAKG